MVVAATSKKLQCDSTSLSTLSHMRVLKVSGVRDCNNMSSTITSQDGATVSGKGAQVKGLRKNGKQWHQTKKPFRPTAGLTSYSKRVAKEAQEAEVKKLQEEMKAEKEAVRQVGVADLI